MYFSSFKKLPSNHFPIKWSTQAPHINLLTPKLNITVGPYYGDEPKNKGHLVINIPNRL